MALDSLVALANTGTGTDVLAGRSVGGKFVGAAMLVDKTGVEIDAANALPVGLSAAQITALQPLATQPVSGTVSVSNFPGSQAVTGPLTDTQLRATALPISGTVTATGPLTDTQLRAAAVSVSSIDITASGTITAAAQSVAIALNGKSGVAMQITGTWVGTLQFEGTLDGTNWVAVNGVFAGSSTPGSTITTNGVVRVTPSGLAQVRITSTAWTSGTATISIRASDATGGTFLNQSLTAGANIIGKVGIDQTTPGTTNRVDVGTVNGQAPAFGSGVRGATVQRVTIATDDVVPISAASLPLPTGAATETTLAALNTKTPALGQGVMTASSPVVIASNQTTFPVTATSTPATPTATILSSAATTNGTVVKASAGTIYGLVFSNINAAARFLKLYNSATVTVGTTAVALTIPCPANSVVQIDFGPQGMRYGTGICLSITGAAADTDTTIVGLNENKVNLAFI